MTSTLALIFFIFAGTASLLLQLTSIRFPKSVAVISKKIKGYLSIDNKNVFKYMYF